MPLPPRPLPPSSIGWLGGGFILKPAMLGFPPEGVDMLPTGVPIVGVCPPGLPSLVEHGVTVAEDLEPGSRDGVSLGSSRCNGDEWLGELLFLLCESPFPPRDELRGETLPVCGEAISLRKYQYWI